MANSKSNLGKVVKLTAADYATLIGGGTISKTIGGVSYTFSYEDSALYLVDEDLDVTSLYRCYYSTTTATQVSEALAASKIPYIVYTVSSTPVIAFLSYHDSNYYYFDTANNTSTRVRIMLGKASNSWTYATYTIGGCLIEGTKITMADGSYKNIEDIQVGELVRSYNPATKELCEGVVIENQVQGSTTDFRYDAFSNGSYIVTALGHSLLNMEEDKERPMDLDKFKPGDKCLNDKGEVVEYVGQIGHNRPRTNTKYYDILVSSHTYFANGICNAFLPSWRNTLYLNFKGYESIINLPEALRPLFELGYSFQNSERYQDNDDFIREMITETLNKSRAPIERQRELMLKLADTDYKVIKAVEKGTLPSPEDMEARQAYRDEINEIKAFCTALYQKDCEIRHKYYNMLPQEDLELYNEIGFIPEFEEFDNNIHKEFVYVLNKEIEAIDIYKNIFCKEN